MLLKEGAVAVCAMDATASWTGMGEGKCPAFTYYVMERFAIADARAANDKDECVLGRWAKWNDLLLLDRDPFSLNRGPRCC